MNALSRALLLVLAVCAGSSALADFRQLRERGVSWIYSGDGTFELEDGERNFEFVLNLHPSTFGIAQLSLTFEDGSICTAEFVGSRGSNDSYEGEVYFSSLDAGCPEHLTYSASSSESPYDASRLRIFAIDAMNDEVTVVGLEFARSNSFAERTNLKAEAELSRTINYTFDTIEQNKCNFARWIAPMEQIIDNYLCDRDRTIALLEDSFPNYVSIPIRSDDLRQVMGQYVAIGNEYSRVIVATAAHEGFLPDEPPKWDDPVFGPYMSTITCYFRSDLPSASYLESPVDVRLIEYSLRSFDLYC